jgi:hypothetical protein
MKMGNPINKLCLCLPLLTLPTFARGQSDARPEILVLGTYHMANPGHDLHNMQADDVLAPQRQQEITELIEALKIFNPTKIAIEATVGSTRATQQYADYLAGKYTLSRNEIDQIGYRLAKELGHKTIYPVDVDGDFPYAVLVDFAKAHGLESRLDALNAVTDTLVNELGAFQQTHTVLQTLQLVNSNEHVTKDMSFYWGAVRFGAPYDYAGSDLVGAWYQRNIRIYHNIVALADSPNERILVIYGFGHLGWLRQDVSYDPNVKLRKLSELTALR